MKTYQYLLLLATLVGCARAEEGFSEQDQIYVVAGVLGGVCLLLTIATVYNTINNIRLEAKVTMLQGAGAAAVGATNAAIGDLERQANERDLYLSNPPPRDDYRGTPLPRENIRMGRMGYNPRPSYDPRYTGGPAPQPPARHNQYY